MTSHMHELEAPLYNLDRTNNESDGRPWATSRLQTSKAQICMGARRT